MLKLPDLMDSLGWETWANWEAKQKYSLIYKDKNNDELFVNWTLLNIITLHSNDY